MLGSNASLTWNKRIGSRSIYLKAKCQLWLHLIPRMVWFVLCSFKWIVGRFHVVAVPLIRCRPRTKWMCAWQLLIGPVLHPAILLSCTRSLNECWGDHRTTASIQYMARWTDTIVDGALRIAVVLYSRRVRMPPPSVKSNRCMFPTPCNAPGPGELVGYTSPD